MNLNPIQANMTEVDLGHMVILFSYKTPVAVHVYERTEAGTMSWHQYRTEKNWSRTTTRHINKWNPMGGAYGIKPQEYFDGLLGNVNVQDVK